MTKPDIALVTLSLSVYPGHNYLTFIATKRLIIRSDILPVKVFDNKLYLEITAGQHNVERPYIHPDLATINEELEKIGTKLTYVHAQGGELVRRFKVELLAERCRSVFVTYGQLAQAWLEIYQTDPAKAFNMINLLPGD